MCHVTLLAWLNPNGFHNNKKRHNFDHDLILLTLLKPNRFISRSMQSVHGKYETIHYINKHSGKTFERPMNLKEYIIEIDGKEVKYKDVNCDMQSRFLI